MNRSMCPRLCEVAVGGLLAFAFVAPSIAAGWQQTPLPFSAAQVTNIAVAPSQPGRVYIGAYGFGIYRTDDRGTTWTLANGGIPPDPVFRALAVSPADANRIWTATQGSVWRSTNGGVSWMPSPLFPSGTISDLLVVSTNPTLLLASLRGTISSTIYRSTDDGATWSPAAGISAAVHDLDSRISDPTVILAATGSGVARSTDFGTTWATPGVPNQSTLEVVMAPSDASRAYARLSFDEAILKSTNGGISFFSVAAPFNFQYLNGIAVHPMFPDELLVTGSGTQFGCGEFLEPFTRVEETTDGGGSWSESYSVCPSGGLGTEMAYEPADANHVYLAHAGFRHSASGGAFGTWVLKVDGIANYSVRTIEGDLAGTNYIGGSPDLYRSAGDLSDWVHVSSTLGSSDRFEVNFTNPMRMSDVGRHVEASIVTPFFHQSTNGGASWSNVGGLPSGIPENTQIWGAYSNHGDGSVVYANSLPPPDADPEDRGQLYRSVDSGQSYTLVDSLQEFLLDLVVDPLDVDRIFGAFSSGARVQLSTDGGVTFQPRASGLPSAIVERLFMRRADPDYLIVIYENGQVWETFDAGLAWSLRFDLDVPQFQNVSGVDWDEASGHVFLAVDAGGVVTSHPLYDPTGLPTNQIRAVHWDPTQSTLLAGTTFAGLWQQTIGAPVDVPLVVDAAAFAIEVAPNPARDATTLLFAVPNGGAQVMADVFDASGRRIRRLVDGALPAGDRRLVWDGAADNGERASAGVYFVRVRAGGEESTARVVRLR